MKSLSGFFVRTVVFGTLLCAVAFFTAWGLCMGISRLTGGLGAGRPEVVFVVCFLSIVGCSYLLVMVQQRIFVWSRKRDPKTGNVIISRWSEVRDAEEGSVVVGVFVTARHGELQRKRFESETELKKDYSELPKWVTAAPPSPAFKTASAKPLKHRNEESPQ